MKRILFIIVIVAVAVLLYFRNIANLPVVTIMNYGRLRDLDISIQGIKKELAENGFVENKTVRYEIADIAFDHTLIPQVLTNLKNHNPKVMVVVSTPIAQFAKRKIHDIPIVFHAVTDPVDAGLLEHRDQSYDNVTGSSDMQNLDVLLAFAKSILPHAKTVGLLYMTSDNNDAVLLSMMRMAASAIGMSVLAIPIDQIRDIPVRMQGFKEKADLIYVGASGLHAAMPAIASEAKKINIPIFNSEDQAVNDGFALASFGVNYELVGRNAGKLVAKLLNGADIKTLAPIYPSLQDYKCFINRKHAEKFGITIPENAMVVE